MQALLEWAGVIQEKKLMTMLMAHSVQLGSPHDSCFNPLDPSCTIAVKWISMAMNTADQRKQS